MEELYKDINKWIEACENEEIGQLADVLVEGFMWQLEGKTEEPMGEVSKKKKKEFPQKFYY